MRLEDAECPEIEAAPPRLKPPPGKRTQPGYAPRNPAAPKLPQRKGPPLGPTPHFRCSYRGEPRFILSQEWNEVSTGLCYKASYDAVLRNLVYILSDDNFITLPHS
jgi:hypothetical protein